MEADGAPSTPLPLSVLRLRVFKAIATRTRGKSKQTLKSLKIEPGTSRSEKPRTSQLSHDCSSNSTHGYNTRNGYLPRLPKVKTDWHIKYCLLLWFEFFRTIALSLGALRDLIAGYSKSSSAGVECRREIYRSNKFSP